MEEYQQMLWNELNQAIARESLYKYSNIENGLKCLENSTLYFKSPKDFNDPKDCDPSLISTSDGYINQIAKENGINTPISIRTHQKQYVSFRLLAIKNLKEKLIPIIKITCFSKKYKIAKMWERYTENHTGMCIEFDNIELIKCLPEYLRINDTRGFFLQVKYTLTVQKFVYKKADDIQTLLCWVSSKSKDWEYEDEIRFVIPNWQYNTFAISSKVIKAVYLGANILPNDEVRIRQYCLTNFPDAKIIKIVMSDLET